MAGKTLGVIGAGRIGRRVLQIARGFGMRTLACGPSPDAAARQDRGFRAVPLPDLLAASDVVSLHAPVGSGLRLSDPEFALLKTGALLINMARGGAVDPAALLRALSSGRLAGTGLDVIAEEQAFGDEAEIFRQDAPVEPARLGALLADHALARLPNVLVTPHIITPASPSPGGRPERRRTCGSDRRSRILPQPADARFRDQTGAAVRFHARRRLSESLPAVRRSVGGSRATDRTAAWK